MNRNFSGILELIMFGCMGIYVPDGNNSMNPSDTSGKKPSKKSDTSIEPGIWSASEDLHTRIPLRMVCSPGQMEGRFRTFMEWIISPIHGAWERV